MNLALLVALALSAEHPRAEIKGIEVNASREAALSVFRYDDTQPVCTTEGLDILGLHELCVVRNQTFARESAEVSVGFYEGRVALVMVDEIRYAAFDHVVSALTGKYGEPEKGRLKNGGSMVTWHIDGSMLRVMQHGIEVTAALSSKEHIDRAMAKSQETRQSDL